MKKAFIAVVLECLNDAYFTTMYYLCFHNDKLKVEQKLFRSRMLFIVTWAMLK